MEKTRFLGYIAFITLVLVALYAVKKTAPEPKPIPKKSDRIGMNLYRSIFDWGESEKTKEGGSRTQKAEFVDEMVAESPGTESGREDVTSNPDKPVKPKSETKSTVTRMKSNSSQAYFDNLIRDYKKNKLTERRYRNDVVVRYYKHQPDEEKASVLTDYGFYLHVRPVANKRMYETTGSNVIHYGQDFPAEDLQLITYLLIQSGIEIKKVKPFIDFDGWKHKSIEIGADARYQNSPALTLDQIRKLGN